MNTARPAGWRTEELDALCDAILTLRTADEIALFLRDLCTRSEIGELSSRWTVATLLEAGMPYREVSEQTGISTTTIGRVNEWRRHGMGGYRLALDRMRREPDA
ncbi:MAG: YerC/YecD family TrpR-related protein [bacterium]|nr:YerC/YecD family TrpR-related protein [bacterium]